jgi:Domain of unknown function (DUF4166)
MPHMTRLAERPRSTQGRDDFDPGRDYRFRELLSDTAWARLPPAIRNRFSLSLAGGATAVYVSTVSSVSINPAGRLLTHVGRLLGMRLPLGLEAGVPAAVVMTEDIATGGQIWTRVCFRRRGFPSVVSSSVRFQGATGLEEYVGRGIGIALAASVEDAALVLRSERYVLHVRGRRLRLPRWLTPGRITVTHAETSGGSFAVCVEIAHPLLGAWMRQAAVFREAHP